MQHPRRDRYADEHGSVKEPACTESARSKLGKKEQIGLSLISIPPEIARGRALMCSGSGIDYEDACGGWCHKLHQGKAALRFRFGH